MTGVDDAGRVGVGDDGCLMVYDFDPFCFGSEDNARFLKEIGLLLDAAAVCQDKACVLLQEYHLEEREWVDNSHKRLLVEESEELWHR